MDFGETRRHQEDKQLTGAVEHMRRLGPIRTPGPFLVSRHPLSEGRPLLAVSGVFVGASSLCRRMFSGKCVVVCHCGGTEDRGLFAPQSTCPRVLVEAWRQGSHLPYTSTGLFR